MCVVTFPGLLLGDFLHSKAFNLDALLHGAPSSTVTPRRAPTTTPPSPMPAATATPRNPEGSAGSAGVTGGHLATNKFASTSVWNLFHFKLVYSFTVLIPIRVMTRSIFFSYFTWKMVIIKWRIIQRIREGWASKKKGCWKGQGQIETKGKEICWCWWWRGTRCMSQPLRL